MAQKRSSKAPRTSKAATKASEAVATSNRAPEPTRIGELPANWREKPHNRRSLQEWNEDEGHKPTIKIHRPHQERNPEREHDDKRLGAGAALANPA